MGGDGRSLGRRVGDALARVRRRVRKVEPRTAVQIRCERIRHGGWWICPDPIRPGDVVYSFGVGGDLVFERELATEYGARVYAFDPAPGGSAPAPGEDGGPVVDEAAQAGVRVFNDMSVGGRDERRAVTIPGGGVVEARVLRLPSHMRLLGHRRLDLIRLDVPGVEADVIRDLVGMDVDVHQLILSFHEPESPDARDRIEAAVNALGGHGYRVFHISPDRRHFSFIRTDFPG